MGGNEQRLQTCSVMTDKGYMSLPIWVKRLLLVSEYFCHLRALSSLWRTPKNSKLDCTVQHVDDEPAALDSSAL